MDLYRLCGHNPCHFNQPPKTIVKNGATYFRHTDGDYRSRDGDSFINEDGADVSLFSDFLERELDWVGISKLDVKLNGRYDKSDFIKSLGSRWNALTESRKRRTIDSISNPEWFDLEDRENFCRMYTDPKNFIESNFTPENIEKFKNLNNAYRNFIETSDRSSNEAFTQGVSNIKGG